MLLFAEASNCGVGSWPVDGEKSRIVPQKALEEILLHAWFGSSVEEGLANLASDAFAADLDEHELLLSW
jgi:hypothetical protein